MSHKGQELQCRHTRKKNKAELCSLPSKMIYHHVKDTKTEKDTITSQTVNSHFCFRTFLCLFCICTTALTHLCPLNKRKPVLVLLPNFLCFKGKNTCLFICVSQTPSFMFAQLEFKSSNSMVHFNWKHSLREANCLYASATDVCSSLSRSGHWCKEGRKEGLSSESRFRHQSVSKSLSGKLLMVTVE